MKKFKECYNAVREHVDAFSLFVLGLTFLAIAVSTLATWQLKVLTSRQINFNIRPIVMCDINHSSCRIRNIGQGAALYIKADLVSVHIPRNEQEYPGLPEDILLGIESVPCMEANSRWVDAPIKLYDKDMNEISTMGRGEVVQYVLGHVKEIFKIHYQDINFADYSTTMEKKKSGFATARFST